MIQYIRIKGKTFLSTHKLILITANFGEKILFLGQSPMDVAQAEQRGVYLCINMYEMHGKIQTIPM